MTRKLWLLLIALLASGMVAVGCGDDDDEEESDEPAQEQTDTGAAEEAEEEGGDEAEGGGGGDSAAAEQAREACETSAEQVQSSAEQSGAEVPADFGDRIEEFCNEAADAAAEGDQEGVAEASRNICLAAAELYPDAAREQAEQACESIEAPAAP